MGSRVKPPSPSLHPEGLSLPDQQVKQNGWTLAVGLPIAITETLHSTDTSALPWISPKSPSLRSPVSHFALRPGAWGPWDVVPADLPDRWPSIRAGDVATAKVVANCTLTLGSTSLRTAMIPATNAATITVNPVASAEACSMVFPACGDTDATRDVMSVVTRDVMADAASQAVAVLLVVDHRAVDAKDSVTAVVVPRFHVAWKRAVVLKWGRPPAVEAVLPATGAVRV